MNFDFEISRVDCIVRGWDKDDAYETRKFTLRYQQFGMNFDFEISRTDCIYMGLR